MQPPSAGKSHRRVTDCTPAGGAFLFCEEKEPKVIQGCALKTRRTGTPARNGCAVPDRGLNGAYKVPQAHLPPPGLPRFGGGERPPFLCKPIALLTITMGQRLGSLQALTSPERRTAALHLSAHPGPFPAIGKGGGGKVGVPSGSQDPMGRGGRTAAGRAARSVTEGQLDSSGGCARRAPAATLGAILCAVRIDFRLPP